jgi:hypothetical protein
VVPRTDQDGGIFRHGRRTSTGHPREPRAQPLQPPQATGRLGEPEMPLSGLPDGSLVYGRYLRRELGYTIFDGHV